jgi:hypothetical protein
MKCNRLFILTALALVSTGCASDKNSASVVEYPETIPQVRFAASELTTTLGSFDFPGSLKIIFRQNPESTPESYTIHRARNTITVSGSDANGMMYGGLELAETIRVRNKLPDDGEIIKGSPHVLKRGLKFNIPLDIRTPSYQDAGDAAQKNILEMWNFEFWRTYLDMMARNRYNLLTLWNPHPFPSMIRLDEYPDIALPNVCGTSFPLDTDRTDEPVAKFIAGCGVSEEVLNNLVVLKEMTMEEKIAYWRKVMRYAKDRGIEVYFITWNIKLNSVAPPGWYREQELKMGTRGKYGINNDQENPRTIAYLRKSVREFILTYPDLAGIGITAGENMEDRSDAYDREKWLWSTYGEGILDAKRIDPDREIRFIHRFWQSGIDKIIRDFISRYPDPIDLSFKYARARMYATPAPAWADEFIEEISDLGLRSWWNIRNDDIFHFRWGDPSYVSEFFMNLPPEKVTAGYYMGSDGYVWGREFISKHPQEPRELEISKHWFNFMLWGRMGYDPGLPMERIRGLLEQRYSGTNPDLLLKTWATASRIPSAVTRFHWHDWDFQWAVEGCLDLRKGFHTVEDFISNPTMEGSGILTIPEYVSFLKSGNQPAGIHPFQVSDQLDSMSAEVFRALEILRKEENQISASFDELLFDLKAWAAMGSYYAWKIRGAARLHAFRSGLGKHHGEAGLHALESARDMWEVYASAASRNYHPQFMAKTRTIDWSALSVEVNKDLEILRKTIAVN